MKRVIILLVLALLAAPGQAKEKIFADKYKKMMKADRKDEHLKIQKFNIPKQIKRSGLFGKIIAIEDDTGHATDAKINKLLGNYEELVSTYNGQRDDMSVKVLTLSEKEYIKEIVIAVVWGSTEEDEHAKSRTFMNVSFKAKITLEELVEGFKMYAKAKNINDIYGIKLTDINYNPNESEQNEKSDNPSNTGGTGNSGAGKR